MIKHITDLIRKVKDKEILLYDTQNYNDLMRDLRELLTIAMGKTKQMVLGEGEKIEMYLERMSQ